jgi:hypothetical protein
MFTQFIWYFIYHEIFTFTHVRSYFMNKEFSCLKVLWFCTHSLCGSCFFQRTPTYPLFYISFTFSLCSITTVLILHLNGKFYFSSLLKYESKASESCVVITARSRTDIWIWVFHSCGYEEFYRVLLATCFVLVSCFAFSQALKMEVTYFKALHPRM